MPFVPAWPDERIGTKATETPADFNTQLAGRHERRWARGRTITDAGHVVIPDDLHRNLSDYDTAFGVTMDTQVSA